MSEVDILETGLREPSNSEMNPNNMSFVSTSQQEGPNITILAWNCRGLGNDNAVDAVRDVIDAHHPDIVILTKTRIPLERSERVAARFHYGDHLATDTMGYRGGILLLWKSEELEVTRVGSNLQEIHATV